MLIIDLEATCWKENTNYQRKQSEIIEIGVCLLDIETGVIKKNKGILIKPFKSKVSEFCTQLTTITRVMLDEEGVSLREACTILRDEYNSEDLVWGSYGDYDKNMLKNQCLKWGVLYPLSDNHINIKKQLKKISMKPMNMARALNYIGVKSDGTHHRGIDDARNVAKILYWVHNKGNRCS